MLGYVQDKIVENQMGTIGENSVTKVQGKTIAVEDYLQI